jgi:hypothetical protein
MAGRPGTPRFGAYAQPHEGKPDANGQDRLDVQADGPFIEQHYLFNPAQRSREMGTTLGDAPGKVYQADERIYCADANHDGFVGGDLHLNSLDEKKVLDDTVYSVPIVQCDDEYRTFGSDERSN